MTPERRSPLSWMEFLRRGASARTVLLVGLMVLVMAGAGFAVGHRLQTNVTSAQQSVVRQLLGASYTACQRDHKGYAQGRIRARVLKEQLRLDVRILTDAAKQAPVTAKAFPKFRAQILKGAKLDRLYARRFARLGKKIVILPIPSCNSLRLLQKRDYPRG